MSYGRSLKSRSTSPSFLTQAGGLAGGEVEAVLRQARPGAWVLGGVVRGGGDGDLGAGPAAAVAVQLQTVVLRLQLLDFNLHGLCAHITGLVNNALRKEKRKACTINGGS